jgi:hypothetical protein
MSTAASLATSQATFAWQGWQLALPARWNPVKLEGNSHTGMALIADMNRPQLGLRWRTIRPKRFDPRRALRGEVGTLAAAKAKEWTAGNSSENSWSHAMLFIEPEPPGRDVWVGHSQSSGRVLEIVHHVRRRDRMLEDSILPALAETRSDEACRWAIFDLSCIVPGGFELTGHRLNAGDLTLNFACQRRALTIRQVALAQMALARLPLEKWLLQQERAIARHYRPAAADPAEASIERLSGIRRLSRRRGRFAWMRWLPPQVVTYVLRDEARDRLIFVQGDDDSLLRQVATTIGGPRG